MTLTQLSAQPAAETEEFRALERELRRLAEKTVHSGKPARNKTEKEVLPRLREELDELRERLQQLGREEQIETLEMQVQRMMET